MRTSLDGMFPCSCKSSKSVWNDPPPFQTLEFWIVFFFLVFFSCLPVCIPFQRIRMIVIEWRRNLIIERHLNLMESWTSYPRTRWIRSFYLFPSCIAIGDETNILKIVRFITWKECVSSLYFFGSLLCVVVRSATCVACHLIWPVVFVRTLIRLGDGDERDITAQNGESGRRRAHQRNSRSRVDYRSHRARNSGKYWRNQWILWADLRYFFFSVPYRLSIRRKFHVSNTHRKTWFVSPSQSRWPRPRRWRRAIAASRMTLS